MHRAESRKIKLAATFAIIVVGLAGRSALDKVLALRGGSELVALWAQLGSVVELVASVSLAGIGAGLSVLVSQAASRGEQDWLVRQSVKAGGLISLVFMLAAVATCLAFGDALLGSISTTAAMAAAAAGLVSVFPGMINSYWLGRQRRELMLGLALVSALMPLAAALAAPDRHLLAILAVSFCVPALLLAPYLVSRKSPAMVPPEWQSVRKALLRYALPGIAIGVLSPASLVAARSIVSTTMSWQEAGLLQALLRVSDWVTSVAAGFLSVYFLPRLAKSFGHPDFNSELKRAAAAVVLPSAVAFALLLAFQRPVLALLYDDSFRVAPLDAALFFAGSLVRVAAWVPLFALYAMRRTGLITAGEFLSLPLFALLLHLFSGSMSLELAGELWLAAYAVYGAFNLWAACRKR